MRSIGLDIGQYSVKLVELIQNKKNISINQVHEKRLTHNASPADKELEVIEFVRNFVEKNTLPDDTKWIVALKQEQVTTRYKVFPFSDRNKIQKSLSFEMEEDIPFDTENCIFDAKTIQTQGAVTDVLATAIPKHHVEKMVALSDNFSVDISSITIDGIAFANLIEDWENAAPSLANEKITLNSVKSEDGNETVSKKKRFVQIVLNIGHEKTLLAAFENRRLIFVRTLYWGANQLIQEIIKKREVSYTEALSILQKEAVIQLMQDNTSFEQTQMSSMITRNLKELVRDIQMTLLELQSEFNAEISSLQYTGGASLIPNLGGFLTQHLELACNPIYLLQGYMTGNNTSLTLSQRDIEARFAPAVAIALEGFKKLKNPPINLLKGDFAKQNEGFSLFWEKWGTITQIALASVAVFFIWASLRNSFSETLNTKAEEAVALQAKDVARLPKKQANENGVKKYIRDNKKKATEMKLVSQVAGINSAMDILKKISENAPSKDQSKIDILTFQVRDDLVQLVGYATSPREITLLTQNLKSLSSDGVINNNKGNLAPVANRVSFNISFKADRGLVK